MIKVRKKIGQTPLELLNDLRDKNPELKDEILSYAGRLDPMAFGEMLVLVGKDENSRREEFLRYDKTYVAEILFGFSTDSYDLLGKIQDQSEQIISSRKLKKKLKEIKKLTKIKYPVLSSKTVQGRTLFDWYRSGEIEKIKVPSRNIEVKKVKLIKTQEMSVHDLLKYIYFSIGEVNGDFRQKEIIKLWQKQLNNSETIFQVAKIRFKVSSGTYIRSLAHIIGEKMNVPACLLTLERTKIHN
jgi:tRNA pseudouridine55 synthase